METMSDTTAEICVIGLGPRGLSVLERLCANASEFIEPGQTAVLHVVDPHIGSGGHVWRSDQSAELLMNTVSSQVTMFVDESVDCDGPVLRGPSLYEWTQFNALIGPLEDIPSHLYEEARDLGPDDYPTRALYGQYLAWVLHHLIESTPANVRIELHDDIAVDLTEQSDGRQVVTLSGGDTIGGLDSVVLALGHTANRPERRETTLIRHAKEHGLVYRTPANPADVDLEAIEPGRPTVLRGLGLNFFDHLALLTTGRGGKFERTPVGRLRYLPSGKEPQMLAGSRRGIPYHARGENQKGPYGRHEPVFFTAAVIERLIGHAEAGAPIDFRQDVWPLVDHEVRCVYYRALITDRLCGCDADVFTRHYVALHTGQDLVPQQRRSPEPFADTTTTQEAELLERFGVGPEDRWSWRRIQQPYGDRRFRDQAEFRAWLVSYLEHDVAEAKQGNVEGPLKAALDVMRDLRNEIRLVVDHGGLSGDSYRDDLQRWYTPFNAFVSIGPPTERIEQLLALIEAGVLDLLGPQLRVVPCDDGYRVDSAVVPGCEHKATALIEARLPEVDLRLTADPLITTLLKRGDCSLHRIPIRGGGWYETGGLAVSRKPYYVLDADRQPHHRRFAFGVPTETVHWVTAAGIRPGVNSVILGDADGIARAGLRCAVEEPAAAQS